MSSLILMFGTKKQGGGGSMITLIHGFNVSDPEESTGKLRYYLDGAIMFNYGWRFFSVLWHNKKDAKALKGILNNARSAGDRVIFAHSNGCAIAVEAARQGAKINNLICINPALKTNTIFPSSIERILVVYTVHDKATRSARFFDRVPFIQLLIPNAWGAMGAKGSETPDERVNNWDLSSTLNGHSDFFKDENLDRYMPEIKKWLGNGYM